MNIEPLRIEEYDDLINLWNRTGLPCYKEGRDSRQAIEKQIFDDHIFILTLKNEGRLIGSVVASSDGRKGWIDRLAIDPDYRGKRLATRLVEKAEELLAGIGINIIGALIEDQNFPSMAAFRHCGYEGWSEIKYFRKKLT